MIGFYNYTVIATYLSLASSVAGIILAGLGHYLVAVFCLMFSGMLDTFDGRIAATKKDRSLREKRFGVQIDSLCDLVCFGVLPVVIGYTSSIRGNGGTASVIITVVYIVCAVLYVLGGMIRLAFFNINEEEMRERGEKPDRKTYTGMPITTVALIFPVLYIFRLFFTDKLWFALIWAAAMLIIAFCFVGKFKIRKPTNTGITIMIGFGAVIAVIVALVYGIQAL